MWNLRSWSGVAGAGMATFTEFLHAHIAFVCQAVGMTSWGRSRRVPVIFSGKPCRIRPQATAPPGCSGPSHATIHAHIDALRSVLGDIQCPVMYDMDIGHVPPQLSLVNGASAQVKLRDGYGTVVQRLA